MVTRVQTLTIVKIKIKITIRVENLMHRVVLMEMVAAVVAMQTAMHIVPVIRVIIIIIIAVIGMNHLYQMNQDSKADQMVG